MASQGFALLGRHVLLSTGIILCATAAVAAQNKQLNAPFAHPEADMRHFLVDPGETRAVYVADAEIDEVVELYSVPLDRSAPAVKLNGPLPAGGDVLWSTGLEVGANGRVLYCADQSADQVVELFSAPLDGSQPAVRLNPALVVGGDVRFFEMSPDGTRVVYAADQDIDEIVELYAAPSDGSAPAIKLNEPFVPAAIGVTGAWTTPDGSVVVYTTHQPSRIMSAYCVWSVPIDASQLPTLLAEHFLPEEDLWFNEIKISPNGEWLAYELVITASFSIAASYCVPIDGSAPTRSLYSDGYVSSMQFTPGGDWLVFSRFPHVPLGYPENPSHHLVAATLAATTGGIDELSITRVGGFQLTENGSEVDFASAEGIYRVCTDGSSAPALKATASGRISRLSSSPDRSFLVFLVDGPTSHFPNSIFSVPSAGGSPIHLASANFPFGRIISFVVSSDSRHVVYETRLGATQYPIELGVVPIDGSLAPRRLNRRLPEGGTVLSSNLGPGYVVTADGEVVYGADQDQLGVFELFVAAVERTSPRPSPPVPIPSGNALRPGG